jgi:PhnB protein
MAKVNAVPDGYHTVTPYLAVAGAAEALEFYKKAFGAEERSRVPAPNGRIMHSEIKIGDSMLMVSDPMMGEATKAAINLYVPDANAAWSRATAAGCEVVMPIADQFWGDRYGVLKDKWGNRWSIAQRIEDVPEEEMRKRTAEAMKNMPK